MISLIKTPKSLVLNFPGGITKTIPVTSQLADNALKMIKSGASDADILCAIDIVEKINRSGAFEVRHGQVFVSGEVLPDSLSTRIIDFMDNGLPFAPLLQFWENCKLNPDPRAKTDLYKFLEHNGHPITADGCFIGYRAVRKLENGKFTDKQTGTFDNSVGSVVKMNRDDCDADPNQTCSRGLHVAAMDYVANVFLGSGDVIVEVKVNPKDVVAIPVDYNGQKMRVCEFQVLAVNAGLISRPLYDPENVLSDEDEDDTEDEDSLDYHYGHGRDEEDESGATVTPGTVDVVASTVKVGNDNWKRQQRDANGRFIPKNKSGPRRDSRGRFLRG
jgi:hypothetical protein